MAGEEGTQENAVTPENYFSLIEDYIRVCRSWAIHYELLMQKKSGELNDAIRAEEKATILDLETHALYKDELAGEIEVCASQMGRFNAFVTELRKLKKRRNNQKNRAALQVGIDEIEAALRDLRNGNGDNGNGE